MRLRPSCRGAAQGKRLRTVLHQPAVNGKAILMPLEPEISTIRRQAAAMRV
jgi:hypothetical protein